MPQRGLQRSRTSKQQKSCARGTFGGLRLTGYGPTREGGGFAAAKLSRRAERGAAASKDPHTGTAVDAVDAPREA
jgi:hypothetical protein